MTIKDCIDVTIQQHPDFTCELILEAYFMMSERARIAAPNPNSVINPNAFSSNVRSFVRDKNSVIKNMEEECNIRLGDNFIAFINMYINWYNSKKDKLSPKAREILNFDKFREQVNSWISDYGIDYAKQLLIKASSDPRIKNYIETGKNYVEMRGGIDLNADDYAKFIMFIDDNAYYYDLYEEEKNIDETLYYKNSIDYVLSLNLNDNQKASILHNLYEGDYNPMLDKLPSDVTKDQILYVLVRNTLRSGLICANKISINEKEGLLFSGLHGYEQANEIEKLKEFVLNKLCINDVENGHLGTYEDFFVKLETLPPEDIIYMSKLYVQTQKAGRDVIESEKMYVLDDSKIDKDYFEKVVYALKIIENRRLRLSRPKNY